ncbi:MAG: hypothetical protein QOJ76_2643 [Acidobacteriota bacterium]|jgi:hypothetical protein|nr:hypothetical protein [Acidobacteriota bacterium]
MTYLRVDAVWDEWVRRVRDSLRTHGYYYEQEFCNETSDAKPVVAVARMLGQLHTPDGTDPASPAILTQPSASAPEWRPFDRRSRIGWHNDFSTRPRRPVLSLSWIRHEDPSGPDGGAWRLASAPAVLAKLLNTREGKRLVTEFSTRAEHFGYRDAGGWCPFRVITQAKCNSGGRGLRFYGRALEEGALLRFGHVPDRTKEIIARVEAAADTVGEVLRASIGALLVVDNRLSLHDRLEQTVASSKGCRRQSWLCFVQRLHEPL